MSPFAPPVGALVLTYTTYDPSLFDAASKFLDVKVVDKSLFETAFTMPFDPTVIVAECVALP